MDRETALRNLSVGDIFHARGSGPASLVCLVTAVDDGTIYARRIHTQDDLQFDRTTGVQLGKVHTKIDCVRRFRPTFTLSFCKWIGSIANILNCSARVSSLIPSSAN
jgi:hypothetical protein